MSYSACSICLTKEKDYVQKRGQSKGNQQGRVNNNEKTFHP